MNYEKTISARVTQEQYDKFFLYCANAKVDISGGIKKFIDSLPSTPEQMRNDVEHYEKVIAIIKKKLEMVEPEKHETPERGVDADKEELNKIKSGLIRSIMKKYPPEPRRDDEELGPIIKSVDEEVVEAVKALNAEKQKEVGKAVSFFVDYYYKSKEQKRKLTQSTRFIQ